MGDRNTGADLEAARKEAKRWLKDLRLGDAEARARLLRVHPHASEAPVLRDVQFALARERGFESWRELSLALSTAPARSRDEAIVALLQAAESGDAEGVAQLLDTHPDILDERGLLPGHSGMRTALHFATNGPHAAVIALLVERGADPNVRCEGDWAFPLHFLAEKGALDLVRLLVEHDADPIGAGDYHDLEVIGWATAFDYVTPRPELVDYLLAHGARHTIFSAVAVGDIAAIREIVARAPAELERQMAIESRRRRPLHLAVVKGQRTALVTLLDLGADPNALDESGMTPVDDAVVRGRMELAQLLVERGADVTLAAALVLERTDDIQRLLAKDPDGLRPGHRWGTLLVRVAERAPGRVVETLLRYGAAVDVRDDPKTAIDATSGYTPLHAAAFHGNLEAVEVLLAHGADVRARDERFEGAPARWAAFAGHTAVRDRILEGAIDIFEAIEMDRLDRLEAALDREPEARDARFECYLVADKPTHSFIEGVKREAWYTPLAFAAHGGRLAAVKLLLERGADPGVRSPDGRTPADLAREAGHASVVELLRQ